jgi:hypothetical protein
VRDQLIESAFHFLPQAVNTQPAADRKATRSVKNQEVKARFKVQIALSAQKDERFEHLKII